MNHELTPCQRCGTPTPLGVSYCNPCHNLLTKDTAMQFRCTFNGRKVGAIGASDRYTTVVEAENEDAARLKCYDHYDHYEHISQFKAEAITEPAKPE